MYDVIYYDKNIVFNRILGNLLKEKMLYDDKSIFFNLDLKI